MGRVLAKAESQGPSMGCRLETIVPWRNADPNTNAAFIVRYSEGYLLIIRFEQIHEENALTPAKELDQL